MIACEDYFSALPDGSMFRGTDGRIWFVERGIAIRPVDEFDPPDRVGQSTICVQYHPMRKVSVLTCGIPQTP